MHEYVSMWEHGLLRHPGMPMLPWPAQRCWERDHRRRCRRAFPAVCDLANSIHYNLLRLAPRNHWPVLHTWSWHTVVQEEGGCVVGGKNCLDFVFGTVDWRSDNRFSMLFIARPPFKANKLQMLFLVYCQVGILQDNFRILPVCCVWNYFLWIGYEVGMTLCSLSRITLCPGDVLNPFCNISTELYSQVCA